MIHNTHPVQLIHRYLDVVGVGPEIIDEFKREEMCSVSNHVPDMPPENTITNTQLSDKPAYPFANTVCWNQQN